MEQYLHVGTLIMISVIAAATPLLFAALGELVSEKSGVLNLGVEGMMLVGAVIAFQVVHSTDNAILGVLAGILSGIAMSLIFSFLTLTLKSNQVATGLALTIFGVGLSALLGKHLEGMAYHGLPKLDIPYLSDIPVIGPLIFHQDALVYLSLIMVLAIHWFFNKTRYGLVVRAVGESAEAAHSIGYPVITIRYFTIMFGGAMSGLAGAYLSLSYSPLWAENMTAGRGWIALALVVFASWYTSRVLMGAYIFGGITILQLNGQAWGIPIPSEFLSMLPYLATIVVLVLISREGVDRSSPVPASLGKSFHPAH